MDYGLRSELWPRAGNLCDTNPESDARLVPDSRLTRLQQPTRIDREMVRD